MRTRLLAGAAVVIMFALAIGGVAALVVLVAWALVEVVMWILRAL